MQVTGELWCQQGLLMFPEAAEATRARLVQEVRRPAGDFRLIGAEIGPWER